MTTKLITKQRDRVDMAVSTAVSPFGCCNFFDHCTDEIMSLHFGGRMGLLDWMGFNVSDVCYRSIEFINFVRPAYSQRVATPGYISDPCADPNGIEFGSCKLTVEDFGRLGRKGPTRVVMAPKFYCKTDPRRRLDGTIVTDEREWDMQFAMSVLMQDLYRLLITGNATTAGQFDGLERWVKTGYDCGALDSTVIDWNGNSMSGGAGITWNGAAVAATYDFINVLLAVYRRIKQRISWSPLLSVQRMAVGDMILVLPTNMIQCLLDFFTCWSVCDGGQYTTININSYEARTYRTQLMGGMFGFGRIFLDGFEIPLLGYDWELIKGPTLGDIYLLTGSIGGIRIWEGEHLSAATAAAQFGAQGFFSTDGGRVLGKIDADNECYETKIWLHPRLFCKAPWAQARFQDVQCLTPGGPLSPDPLETSFYPETSFSVASCP